ncbi:MAG: hypothetical protein Q9194_001217 [Teloschistes cf. exilis]
MHLLQCTRLIILLQAYILTHAHSAAILSPDSLTKNLSSLPLGLWYDFAPFSKTLLEAINRSNNGTTIPPLRSAGCYRAEPRATYISPQDATVALGLVATTTNFFNPQSYDRLQVLQTWRSAMIILIQGPRPGSDDFSMFDIVGQALHVVNYCVFQQAASGRLGGAIEVGTGDRFMLVVRGYFTADHGVIEA